MVCDPTQSKHSSEPTVKKGPIRLWPRLYLAELQNIFVDQMDCKRENFCPRLTEGYFIKPIPIAFFWLEQIFKVAEILFLHWAANKVNCDRRFESLLEIISSWILRQLGVKGCHRCWDLNSDLQIPSRMPWPSRYGKPIIIKDII